MRVLLAIVMSLSLFVGAASSAEPTPAPLQEQVKMMEELANEYARLHTAAVREKVAYKKAYEDERALRHKAEKQLADLAKAAQEAK